MNSMLPGREEEAGAAKARERKSRCSSAYEKKKKTAHWSVLKESASSRWGKGPGLPLQCSRRKEKKKGEKEGEKERQKAVPSAETRAGAGDDQ